jgi:hypothetical protein
MSQRAKAATVILGVLVIGLITFGSFIAFAGDEIEEVIRPDTSTPTVPAGQSRPTPTPIDRLADDTVFPVELYLIGLTSLACQLRLDYEPETILVKGHIYSTVRTVPSVRATVTFRDADVVRTRDPEAPTGIILEDVLVQEFGHLRRSREFSQSYTTASYPEIETLLTAVEDSEEAGRGTPTPTPPKNINCQVHFTSQESTDTIDLGTLVLKAERFDR